MRQFKMSLVSVPFFSTFQTEYVSQLSGRTRCHWNRKTGTAFPHQSFLYPVTKAVPTLTLTGVNKYVATFQTKQSSMNSWGHEVWKMWLKMFFSAKGDIFGGMWNRERAKSATFFAVPTATAGWGTLWSFSRDQIVLINFIDFTMQYLRFWRRKLHEEFHRKFSFVCYQTYDSQD